MSGTAPTVIDARPLPSCGVAISRDVVRRAAAEPDRLAVLGPVKGAGAPGDRGAGAPGVRGAGAPGVQGAGALSFGELADRAQRRREKLADGAVVICGDEPGAEPVDLLLDVLAADLAGGTAIVPDPTWPRPVRSAALAAARELVAGLPRGTSRLVVFTSGSTGAPKPIVRATTSWTWSFPTFSAYTGIGPGDRVLIPGGLGSSLFLFGALHALTMGAAIRVLPRWSTAPARAGVRDCTVVHLVPSMVPFFLAQQGNLRLIVCAGAQLDPALVDASGAAGIELVEYAGAAELSFVAIRRGRAALRAFPGVDLEVRDGLLYARSPFLATNIERDAEGYATVGDHARLAADGALELLGRGEAAISTGGHTVRPEGVELALRRAPGVGDVAVIGLPHDRLGQVVTALVERADGQIPSVQGLRTFAAAQLRAAERPRRWYVVDRLPRNAAGKLARAEAAELAGRLRAQGPGSLAQKGMC